ncbi:ADP-ribosylation factor like protein 1 [Capronia epimyces CBS 606.96]|uniref:ADP-ribosylation factor like protein 1 n=1 Tax=Capronia epimyces CBS 606.96 TaxID=1182542 RepID=W9YE35_9EURO|nr:ADP-ribosylation factor like protein 1 [Capronia epimyces CBS 606.96]EXJ87526.1 ADP-ribosylation factor like protein 1 [Capronia epimyces CBS 606.96]
MYHLIRSLYLYATSKPEYSIILLGLDNAGKTTLLSQIKALYNTAVDPAGQTGDAPPSDTAGNTVPTVGQNVATIDLPDMYLKIWDVGGQMSLRRLWTSYYKSAHAVVFVLDSTDLGNGELDDMPRTPGWHGRKKSFLNKMDDPDEPETPWTPMTPMTPTMLLSGQHQGRLDECRAVLETVLDSEDTAGIPILVLANKQDREDCLEVVRIKEGFVRKVFEGEKGGMVRDSRVLPVSALRGTGVKEAIEWVKSRVVWNKESRPPVMR